MITQTISPAEASMRGPQGFDLAAFSALNDWWSDRNAVVWRWFDEPLPLVLAAIAFAVGGRLALRASDPARRRAGFGLLVGYVATTIVVDILKDVCARPRPLLDAGVAALFPTPEGLADLRSFPSGHVAGATAVVVGLWVLFGASRLRWLLLPIPLVMAVSRVVLRAHWPTDTLGGIAVGVAVPAVVLVAFDRFRVDRLLVGWSPLRCALGTLAVLSLIGVFSDPPVAFDPVTGAVIEGVRSAPRTLRLLFEPWAGPLLTLSHHSVMGGVVPPLFALVGFAAGAVAVCRFALGMGIRGIAATLVVSVMIGAALVAFHLIPNDRVTVPAGGVLVDFHLHGGDPIDGLISPERLARRQAERGVRWATLSWHDDVALWDRETGSATTESTNTTALVAVEWSGGSHPSIPAPHMLLIGSAAAVEAGLAQSDPLAAVRAAKAAGAYVIVAHAWRGGAFTMPTVSEWVAAGADGFEVGNRGPEITESGKAALAAFDAAVAASGKTRWSFSDDHGIPPSSACVTWVRGLPSSPGDAANAVASLAALKPTDVVPMQLVAAPSTTPIAHVLMPVRYLFAMRPASRLALTAWMFLLAILCARRTN